MAGSLGSRFIDDADDDDGGDVDSNASGDSAATTDANANDDADACVNVFVALWHKIMFYFI